MEPNTAKAAEKKGVPSKDLSMLMTILAGLAGKEVDRISQVEFLHLEGFPDVDILAEIDMREGVLEITFNSKPLATFEYRSDGEEEGEIFVTMEEGRWAIKDFGPRLAFVHKLAEVCGPLIVDYAL